MTYDQHDDARYDQRQEPDQGYDYDDEVDDGYAAAGTPANYVGDAETLLRRAIDIVATAPTMPRIVNN